MNSKFLLLALSMAAFSSCSTAYKSGQTPDDVYFSPIRTEAVAKQSDTRQDDNNTAYYENDKDIRMAIRDRRWRDLNDYDYNYSPYNYCYSNYNNYNTGYYYNPYYYPAPIYTYTKSVKINNTPRMINLNAYHGYNVNTATNIKNGASTIYSNGRNGYGNVIRQVYTPKSNNSSYNNDNNNNRTYTTPSSNNSNSGSSSSSSSSSSSTNTRPARGN